LSRMHHLLRLLTKGPQRPGIFTTTGRILFYNTRMKRNFWKITDALFRISPTTNSFTYTTGCVPSLQFSTGPSNFPKLWVLCHPSMSPEVKM
jgi:hypothetical protein